MGCHKETLPIQCEQKKAPKKIPSESDFIAANIAGFGDDIGSVTNRITTQTDIQAGFSKGEREYEELEYRVISGQFIQQNCIDKLKGIISNGMPKHWYKRKSAAETDDPINIRIVADRKPYFMIYRYPEELSRYRNYIDRTQTRCRMEFGVSIEELRNKESPTPRMREFLDQVASLNPVIDCGGTMNRLCHIVEAYFEARKTREHKADPFDSSLLKSDKEYSSRAFAKIQKIYHDFCSQMDQFEKNARLYRISEEESKKAKTVIIEDFTAECGQAVSNAEELCNILVDLCYKSERSKRFAWLVCSEQICRNLLKESGNKLCYLEIDQNGAVEYAGERFSPCAIDVGGQVNLQGNFE